MNNSNNRPQHIPAPPGFQGNPGGIRIGNRLNNGRVACDLERDQRTMLFTFSIGLPISETCIQTFLEELLGSDAVETIQMQNVARGVKPMYACVVFRSADWIDIILQGNKTTTFLIEESQVWSWRYLRTQD